MKPRQPSSRERETVAIPSGSNDRPGRCGEGLRLLVASRRTSPGRRGSPQMPADALKCKECSTTYPLEARYVCERCFGPLEVAYRAPTRAPRAQAPHPGGAAHALALRRLPPARGPGPLGAADGLDAAREGRPPRRAARPRRALDQERDRQPDALVQGSRRLRRARARQGARLRHGRLRLDRQPRQRASARTPPTPGLPAYVFIPADLEPEKILATGAYGANIVAIHGNYDAVNRLCTEVAGERAPWAFVNVNLRPYYAEGSKTLAYETAEQLGWELPDRVVAPIASGSLFTKVARGFQEFIDAGLLRASCPPSTAPRPLGCSPVAPAFAAAPTSAARSSRTRSPSRWRSATRPTARTPSSSRAHRRRHRQRHRRRDPRRHPAARRDHRHLHRDRRRRDHRGAGQARRARRHRARRARVVPTSRATASRRSTRCAARSRSTEIARLDRRVRRGVRAGGRGLMAVTVKLPTQLRDAAGGAAAARSRRHGRRGARGALRRARRAARAGSPTTTAACAASSTCTSRARTSASSTGLDTPVSDGDEVTILPAVAGG